LDETTALDTDLADLRGMRLDELCQSAFQDAGVARDPCFRRDDRAKHRSGRLCDSPAIRASSLPQLRREAHQRIRVIVEGAQLAGVGVHPAQRLEYRSGLLREFQQGFLGLKTSLHP